MRRPSREHRQQDVHFRGDEPKHRGTLPKEYMATLSDKSGVSDDVIDKIVATHLINPQHLRTADLPAYFNERSEALLVLISDAMGKEAIREDDTTHEGDTTAFVDEPDDNVEADLLDLSGPVSNVGHDE